jgi:hypothetical protein
LLGTLLGEAHVASGTIVYTHPTILGLAWWVPLLYATAGLGIGLSHPSIDARVARPQREITPENVLFGLVGLAVVWVSSGYLPMKDAVRSLVLGPLALGVWFVCDRTRYGLVLALATAIVGCLVELTLLSLGAFRYAHPDAGPIASWLPWIYVTASVAVGNLGRFIGDNAPLPAPMDAAERERPMPRAGGDS